MLKKAILFLFLFIWVEKNHTQELTFQSLNTSSGLSNSTVIALIQDKKGFLWIGTDDGLNRFDGFEFKTFKPQPKNENSLTSNIAKALYEDSHGNIWIGTDGGGLSKFDPVLEKFTNYQNSEKDSYSLSHNNVSAIAEDKNGNIYVATYGGGLNVLPYGEKSFKRISDKNGLSSNYINALQADNEGNLWIGTWAKGIDVLNLKSRKFKNFQNIANNLNSLGSNTVNCFFLDKNGVLWAGAWQGGLNHFDKKTGNFVQDILYNSSHTAFKPIIRSISADHLGNLWLGTYGDGLISFNIKTGTSKTYISEANKLFTLTNNNIWSTCYTNDNVLWIGTIDGGLNKLDLNKKKFEQINNITGSNDPFKASIISAITENQDGELLIGTREDGYSVLDSNLKFKKNTRKQGQINLISNNISCILQDHLGDIWIATQEGITKISKNKIINYSQQLYNSNSLSINNVTNLFEDKRGNIWIATWGGGVNMYKREDESFEHFQAFGKTKVTFKVNMKGQKVSAQGVHIAGYMNGWNPSDSKLQYLGGDIYCITLELYPGRIEYKFINGNRWGLEEKVPQNCAENNNRALVVGTRDITLNNTGFGTSCGDISYGPEKTAEEANFISSNHVYCINEDSNSILWFGTNNGLSRFDRNKNEFKNFTHKIEDPNSISDNHVSFIHISKDGKFWIGTLGGGLNYFDPSEEKFTTYTETDGLANNMIKSILEDDKGFLWIATNNGISKFNPQSHDFLNFDSYNGLKENSFYIGACLKRKNGQLLFGSIDGIAVFHPDSFDTSNQSENVCFSDFRIFNKSVPVGKLADGRTILEKSIQYADEIRLSYKDNIISFHFSNLQFAAPEKNRFAYKLEGFDNDWHYTDARNRSATYTNLNGGKYTFYVKTLNDDGSWSNSPTKLLVYVTPPFWKSNWFILTVLLALVGGLYLWYRFRIKARERKLLNEKILAESKVMQLEKEKLENEVEHKNTELASLTMHITNKTKLLNEQISHLEIIARQSDKSTQERLERMIAKLQDDTSMEKDWEFFEKHFDKVHLNFISNLKNRFPELSANEIRLAAYIRMGMSTKEIAEITNKTIRGVESSRYRLRQNLGLDTSENLNDFLFKL